MADHAADRQGWTGLLARDEDVVALLKIGHVRRWRSASVLFNAGDSTDYVLLLRKGRVKVWSSSIRGTEAVLAIRGPGELIGDFSAVDSGPRSATVTALGAVEALVVTGPDFRAFLRNHVDVTFALLSMIVARVRETDRYRADFGAYDVAERIGRLLLDLSDSYGVPDTEGPGIVIDVPLSQAELASATGASREAVARALRRLRESGTVSTRRRCIVVLRPEVLRAEVDLGAPPTRLGPVRRG